MSETEVKDEILPSQNGGTNGGIDNEKPVKDPPIDTVKSAAAADIAEAINESDDKLDEFSRLELEMAELDKTDDDKLTEKSISCAKDSLLEVNENDGGNVNKDVDNENNDTMQKNKSSNSSPVVRHNGQSAETTTAASLVKENMDTDLNHEDLIAVLKGDTIENEKPFDKEQPKKLELPKGEGAPENVSDLLIEGVTIEGEGEYQIMEVVDDIEDEAEDILPSTSKALSAGLQSNKKAQNQKLTPEQERAMAMEQIAGLNARGPRRRKQDIKPLQIETSELVSNLGADWSDDEEDIPTDSERPTSSKNAAAAKQIKVLKKEIPIKSQLIAQEGSSSIGDTKITAAPSASKKRRDSTGAKVTSVVLVKPADPVGIEAVNEASNNVSDDTISPAQESTGTTGFKRTRTIKRRIIWDPDAPETAFSYAKLVRNNAKERPDSSSPIAIPNSRSVTPKEAIANEKRGTKRSATPLQSSTSKSTTNESGSKAENLELPSTSKQALRSQTISPDVNSSGGSASGGKKKKISEIDRLMGDEGAANMLNSLETGRNKAGEDSDNKPHKPLMRSRGSTAEKVAKKDATVVPIVSTSTPKNKRGVKAKASTSWDYVYQKKQQLSDDSMIIRRRSNSSYSSNASQHRLSLDGPTGITPNSNAKSSEVLSDDTADISKPGTPRKSPSKAASKSANNTTDEESLSLSLNKSVGTPGSKNFIFAKPKDAKSNQKTPNRRSKANANASNTLANDIKKSTTKRGPGRPSTLERLANIEQTNAQPTSLNSPSTIAPSSGEEVTVRKIGKTAHILFNMSAAQISCTFTPQLMNKLVSALDNLAVDVTCHVVVVTTNSLNFCQGLDITNLATGNVEQRKSAANVLATATKNFLRTLAAFPKPLVAGIHGSLIGLGVIQLPLFDVVVASDKTSFETPYAKIGQTPEGLCIWQSMSNIRETAKTKLLWLAEKMYSTEASTTGLIDKLTTAERVNDDAMNIAKKMAAMSTETYRYMKNSVIKKRLEVIDSSLDDEFEEIKTQWASVECFNKFKKSLENGHF